MHPDTFLKSGASQCSFPIEIFPDGGEFVYFGIKTNLLNLTDIRTIGQGNGSSIKLDINMDGCPIFKSLNTSVWPILCSVSNSVAYKPCNSTVFVIAIYYGSNKPNVNLYLKKLCVELNELILNGIILDSNEYKVEVRSFIADAPARALIKETVYHGGHFDCDRCEVKGTHKNGSMSYADLNAKKRTHQSFVDQTQAGHHKGINPLTTIQHLNMISHFPLDDMHLVLLGIMRKLLYHWNKEVPHKLSSHQKDLVNDGIGIVRMHLPEDFNRLPRKLDETERFKATEFRLLLLYTACITFHKILDSKKFNHFLLLMYAMRIFCDPEMSQNEVNVDYGQKLCVLFVKQYSKIYKANLTYNIHSLIHLADDVKYYGALDSISAFPFESMLGKIKRTVRSSNMPLKQLVNRFKEGSFNTCLINSNSIIPKGRIAIGSHYINPAKKKDSCVILRDGNVGYVSHVDGKIIKFKKFKYKYPAFTYPTKSYLLDMCCVTDLHQEISINIDDIKKKCFICLFNKKYIIIPLL